MNFHPGKHMDMVLVSLPKKPKQRVLLAGYNLIFMLTVNQLPRQQISKRDKDRVVTPWHQQIHPLHASMEYIVPGPSDQRKT